MTYIVVSENEIVKAEMERPEFNYQFPPDGPSDSMLASAEDDYQDEISAWEYHCLSLPRIPIQGKHNWKVWQEVKEGKDFEFRQIPDGGRSVKSAEGIPYDYEQWFKLIAIPIEQTKSEQGGDVREGLIRLRNYFGEHDRTPFEHWAYNFINNLLTNDNPQTP